MTGGVSAILIIAVGVFLHRKPEPATTNQPKIQTPEPVPVGKLPDAPTRTGGPEVSHPDPVPPIKPVEAPERRKRTPTTKVLPDFKHEDIPRLLRWAEGDSGAGRWSEAKFEYEKVLELDPNNENAERGLQRLKAKMKGDNKIGGK